MAEATKPAAVPGPAPQTVNEAQAFLSNLLAMKAEFEPFLPDPVKMQRFLQTCALATQRDPKLLGQDVNRQSLYTACIEAAQDGLTPDGREATLNLYNTNVGTREQPRWEKRVKYMPMTQGLLKKIRNSGECHFLHVDVVYEKDQFESFVDESGPHVKHTPAYGDQRGNARLAFAAMRTKDGAMYVEVMTFAQLEAVRKVSKSTDKEGKSSGPWGGDFKDEMYKKTVIRRLSKRVPMSSDLDEFIRKVDADIEFDEDKPDPDKGPKTVSDRLAAIVDKTEGAQPQPAAAAAGQEHTPL